MKEGDILKKQNIVKKNEDYYRIIKNIKPYKCQNYLIYLEWTSDDNYHFGFSISKKIATAVKRNKIKRQIKSILDKKDYQKGFNCIIMVKRSILNCSYKEMEEELLSVLKKLKLIKEQADEEKIF